MSGSTSGPHFVRRRVGFFVKSPFAESLMDFFRRIGFVLTVGGMLLQSPLAAQSLIKIEGTVIDAESGRPLPGANVVLVGTAYGAAADEAGRFAFEDLFNGFYRLQVGFMGYEPLEVSVNVSGDQPVRLLLRMRPRVIEMPELQAIGEREAVTEVLVLTRADIRRSQAATLGELLASVGLTVSRTGSAGARETISIRGSNANQVLVTLDGVRLNDELSGEADLSQVPLNLINRVEIQRGGGALFGSGAVGGVIRLTTLRNAEARMQANLRGGSFNFRSGEASWSRRSGDFELAAAAQAIASRGNFDYRYQLDDRQTVRAERINSDFASANLFLQSGCEALGGTWLLKAHHFLSDRGQPGSVFYPTPYARSEVRRSMAAASFSRRFGAGDLVLQVSAADNRTNNSNRMPSELTHPFGPVPPFDFENRLQTVRLQGELHQPAERRRIVIEAQQVSFSDRNLSSSAAPIGRAKEHSAAASVILPLSRTVGRFTLSCDPSLRYDAALLEGKRGQRREQNWSPQLQLYATVGRENRLWLKGSTGRAFRLPTFADLFYQDFRVQGQADLLPEKSRYVEAALGTQLRCFGNWRGEVRRFRNCIDDMIVWRLGSFEFFRPYNTDAELNGYEAELSFARNVFTADLFYSFIESRNKNRNQTLFNKLLPYRPRESLRFSISFTGERLQSALQYRYAGRRYVNEANTKSLPPYGIIDWTLSRRFPLRRLELQLNAAVFNLLGRRYELVRDMPLPGRELRLGLTVSF